MGKGNWKFCWGDFLGRWESEGVILTIQDFFKAKNNIL